MSTFARTRPARGLLLALLVLTAWRLGAAMHANLELYADEAQYFDWSRQLDWGYYSKPPMLAWIIRLSTELFGTSELGVRAMSFILYPLGAWTLFIAVRRLFAGEPGAERWAAAAAFAYATLPLVALGSWLITTDAALLLFWSLALYLLVRALDRGAWRDWILLGLCVGLGGLSKYTMVFFPLALAAYLLSSPRHRFWLGNPKPWIAAAVALLVLLPNLLWNASHDFASFRHTAEISQLDRELVNPVALAEFFGAQFMVFGPLMLAALLLAVFNARRWWANERMRMLAFFTLLPLAAFLGLSLLSRAFANWAAFAYVAGAAFTTLVLLHAGRRRLWLTAVLVNLGLGAAIYHAHAITAALGIELTRKTDPYARVTGARALGEEVRRRLEQFPDARLVGDDRKTFALLLYYARPESDGARYFNPDGRIRNHYALTRDVRASPAGEFILISRAARADTLAMHFAVVEALPPIQIPLYRDHTMHYSVWRLRHHRAAMEPEPTPQTPS